MKTRPRDSNPRAAACVVTYLAARRAGAARRGGVAEQQPSSPVVSWRVCAD